MKSPQLSVLVLAGLAGLANAATIITPFDVTATTAGLSNREIGKIIDGSGLLGVGDILTQTHVVGGVDGDNHYYLSDLLGGSTAGETITFDLANDASAFTVSSIHVWQYDRNNDTWNGRGINTFDLAFSTDGGTTFPTVVSGLTLTEEPADGTNPFPAQTLSFASQSGVTDIRIQNITIFDPAEDRIGLMEVRFSDAVPEPGTGALTMLTLSLGLLRRRR